MVFCPRLTPMLLVGLAAAMLVAPGGTAAAATDGVQVARPSSVLSVSSNGRSDVFVRDLRRGIPGFGDGFVRDLRRGTTHLVTLYPAGTA